MVKYRQFVSKIMKLTFYLIIVLTAFSFLQRFKPFLFVTWASLFFFLGLTLFSGYYNSRSIKKPFFLNIYFVMLSIKFFASIAFIFIYFFLFHPYKYVFIPFFLIFSVYKAFEVVMLLQFAKDMEGLDVG